MANMNKMMKQAQQMQKQMEVTQQAINKEKFTGKAPEELIVLTMTGDRKATDVQIDKQAIDEDDPDMLSDLLVSAINDAEDNIEKTTKKRMRKYSKGMGQ